MRIGDGKPLKSVDRHRGAALHGKSLRNAAARALVICPILKEPARKAKNGAGGDGSKNSKSEVRLGEAVGLARAIGLDVVAHGFALVSRARPATLFGAGKVEEWGGLLRAEGAELVIVDYPLSPVQQRNLERAWDAKVLDRTGLILEIFGRRARTKEGLLQVELAHLTYQKSRLVRSWTHLERQRGGYGFLGGPGETQIEADRRVIKDRIGAIRKDLDRVKRTRHLHRHARERVPYPVVALVGYTNAGKSTLFNRLTGAEVHVQNLLFATLDPTMREVRLPARGRIILSDTVGFISELPTTLIAAFRATLEEVVEADLLLHVRDISHPESDRQRGDVDEVLRALGLEPSDHGTRLIEVWNKIDLLGDIAADKAVNRASRSGGSAVCISAASGQGIDDLLELLEAKIRHHHEVLDIELDPQNGALINWIHENADVLARETQGSGNLLYKVRISSDKRNRLMRRLEADVV